MDVSNKTLAMLLLVVIAATFATTLFSMDKLREFRGPTGLTQGTDAGTANLTITTDIEINFDVSNVNFGSGTVEDATGPIDTCDMDTNGTSNTSGYCQGFTIAPHHFVINNTGNGAVGLLLRSSYDSTNFTGASTNNLLQWWAEDNETGSCTSFNQAAGWSEVNNTYHNICPTQGFDYNNSKDTINLHIRVLIGEDATAVGTQRISTITALADDAQ